MADGAGAHYFALPTGSKLYEFEIEALLGHGGFGITYRATDTLLQETVAIKEFLPNELAIRISDATVRAKSQQAEPDFDAGLKSFLEEARVMARFRHPRIVHVRRFFELHGTGYIVLDYERGKTLSERLSDGPIPDPELRSILSGVLDGLEVIHARAILHRDLKPNNIMLREDGAPVIIDFGAARDFQARHSRSITAIATAGYAPPEQYGVGGQQGPWSDLYALGAIAYRAVSGEPPVDSLRRLRKDPLVPAVVAGAGKYDEALLRTIDWMLKIDEEDRPTSVEQVREALRGGPIAEAGPEISRTVSEKAKGAVSNDGLRTPESGTPSAARPPLRRVGVTAIAISLVVLAGLSAGSYAFYANYQAKQQAERQTQQANDRQRLLAELLGSAGTDQSKLEFFLTTCGLTCPDDLRTQAQVRIDTAKQKQQAELARQDEAAYRAARGDLTKLRAYATSCTTCIFRDAARSEISSIQRQASVQIAAECDRLAAAPKDQQLPPGTTGVDFASIDSARAISACEKAVDAYPNDPRFVSQLGRAFHAARNYNEAVRFYRMGADLGNGPATSNLGKLYYDGTGVAKDAAEAARLFRKAADLGVPAGMTNLASMYQTGVGLPKDDAEALRLYKKAADLGISDGLNGLGWMYQNGLGTAKDYSQAEQLFRKAADLGNVNAMINIANLYHGGIGLAKDDAEAVKFYRKAADLGNADGLNSLGWMYQNGFGAAKDYSQAEQLFRRAADLGNVNAMINIANMYHGGIGVAKSDADAVKFYRNAADLGSAGAMDYLGVMYQYGFGVAKSETEAAQLYRKAADLGLPEAMSNLGAMYLLGLGFTKDYSQALRLFRSAVDLGNAGAMTSLGYMYANGYGVPKNLSEAVRLYQKASELGNPEGMTNLAVLYINGVGVAKNRDEGIRLLRKAADLGNEIAKRDLRLLR